LTIESEMDPPSSRKRDYGGQGRDVSDISAAPDGAYSVAALVPTKNVSEQVRKCVSARRSASRRSGSRRAGETGKDACPTLPFGPPGTAWDRLGPDKFFSPVTERGKAVIAAR
jgi:hypothetical protein